MLLALRCYLTHVTSIEMFADDLTFFIMTVSTHLVVESNSEHFFTI